MCKNCKNNCDCPKTKPEVVFYEDSIEVWDKEGKSVIWLKDEWIEDDEVPFYIASAIVKALTFQLLP
jgi:hypothetical protein